MSIYSIVSYETLELLLVAVGLGLVGYWFFLIGWWAREAELAAETQRLQELKRWIEARGFAPMRFNIDDIINDLRDEQTTPETD